MSKIILTVVLIFMVCLPAFAQDAATPTPETFEYVVQLNDTLSAIAARHGTTISAIMRVNNLQSAQMIIAGQRLRIPVRALSMPAAQPTPAPTEPIPATEPNRIAVSPEFDYGVEAYFDDQDVNSVTGAVAAMGMRWVKLRISWHALEPNAGMIDTTRLDTIIDALTARSMKILLTVTNAPDWARSSTLENGPPDDPAHYAAFVGALAARYAGRVSAYEIWHEPNLRREWNNPLHPVSAESYALLLRAAYPAIKAANPAATVVSAGLAPTGFNDGINALDDRLFLARLYELGLVSFSDAVGAHPFGFANPPNALCCEPEAGIQTHYEHPSFYFLETLNRYREIMRSNGDLSRQIWVTEFGWGTSEDIGTAPENSRFVGDNTFQDQAEYLTRGFELGANSGFVGVMIAYNLNSCVAQPDNLDACYYSLFAPSGQPRPAYDYLSLVFAPALTG
ncbi:MAG: LysM peptidoglycan-binding domain-containing protein [Anaerolineae bacterium]|nr:LysM peptidoglycan-binding domain-containing protein [Anaerolineae bacterium]